MACTWSRVTPRRSTFMSARNAWRAESSPSTPRLRVGHCSLRFSSSRARHPREDFTMGDPAVTPRDLEVYAVRVGDRSIVTVVGDIDIDSCRRLRDELLGLIDAG